MVEGAADTAAGVEGAPFPGEVAVAEHEAVGGFEGLPVLVGLEEGA